MKNQIVCVCEGSEQIICSGRKRQKNKVAASKGCHKGRDQSKREIIFIFPGKMIVITTLLNQQATSENLVVNTVIEEFLCLIEEVVLSDEGPKSEILTGQRRESVADSVGD